MAANDTHPSIPTASPTRGMLRGRMEETPDKAVSVDMGKGDTWARDVTTGKQGVMLDDIPKLLQILKLKIVSAERICITPAQKARYDALEVIAAQALNPTLDQSTFDE